MTFFLFHLKRPLFCNKKKTRRKTRLIFAKKNRPKTDPDHIAIYTDNTLTIYDGKNQPGPLLLASE